MSIPFVRLWPNRERVSQLKPLPYPRRERRADRRAGKADGRQRLPDLRHPKPTSTIKERNTEFVEAAISELKSCLADTADWQVELARFESDFETEAAAQKRRESGAQPSTHCGDEKAGAWRLATLRMKKKVRITKINEREKRYRTAREAHSEHALHRLAAYETALGRVHPYKEHLGDLVHQLVITEHEHAQRRLREREQQIRRENTGMGATSLLEGE